MDDKVLKNDSAIKRLVYLIVTGVLILGLVVLSILLLVNTAMNSGLYGKTFTEKSVYYEDGAAVLDSTTELAAMTVMPKADMFRASVIRNKEFNFGVMSAGFMCKTVNIELDNAGFYEFRGDKITNGLNGNTAVGGSHGSISGHDLSYIAKTCVYRDNDFTRRFDSYAADGTAYYAAFAVDDTTVREYATADEVAARYIASDGHRLVEWVGYRTLDRENDIILGVRTKNSVYTFGNTYNIRAKKGSGEIALDAVTVFGNRTKEIKLLEQLGFFGDGVTLDLDKRAEYIRSGAATPVVMFTVRCTGAQLHELETTFPDVTLFDVEKIA